jgi:hypothetical protein
MGEPIDWVEVSRVGHELTSRHGHGAATYAAKLARKAKEEGDVVGFEFWQAVEASLRPRG